MFPPCVALLLSSLASGSVLHVAPAGPYTQIQDAIAAAQSGDLVLVESGTYASFTVQAMSLTVVADTGANVNLQGTVNVLDLTAGQTVCLVGLNAVGGFAQYPDVWGLHASGNLGSVRCDHCQFSTQWADTDAVLVEDSSDVSFVGCEMTGGDGVGEDFAGGAGVRAADSSLNFFDCTLQGGYGQEGTVIDPSGNGGQGMHAENCTIFSSHSTFTGGPGGFGIFFPIIAPEPGYGGIGVELVPGCLMRVLDSSMVGGASGDPFNPTWDAADYFGDTFTFLSGTRRTMNVPNPVRELTNLNFSLSGGANENVYLLVSTETALQWDPVRNANFLLARPNRTLTVGTTNGSGNLSISLPLSDLGAGVDFEMFYVQPLFVNSSGAQQLGTPICLSALDLAF